MLELVALSRPLRKGNRDEANYQWPVTESIMPMKQNLINLNEGVSEHIHMPGDSVPSA